MSSSAASSAATTTDSTTKPSSPPPSNPLITGYLFLFNLTSQLLWSYVFFFSLYHLLTASHPLQTLYPLISPILYIVQSMAALEIVHSAIGIVRSPLFSSALQVSSRLLLLWGILYLVPASRYHAGFPLMVLSWSLTEIPRYGFYAWNCLDKNVPYLLTFVRYSTFLVLYPTGISGELWNIVVSLKDVSEKKIFSYELPNQLNFSFDYYYFLCFILATYPYGSYFMYTYMMKQRRKVLGGGATTEKKQK